MVGLMHKPYLVCSLFLFTATFFFVVFFGEGEAFRPIVTTSALPYHISPSIS